MDVHGLCSGGNWWKRMGASDPLTVTGCETQGAECRVEVYQHGDFTGWKAIYPRGDFGIKGFKARGAKNDDMSAIKVIGDNCQAELYQHGDFSGWKVVFPTGSYNYHALKAMGAKNDDASSLEAIRVTEIEAPYRHAGKGVAKPEEIWNVGGAKGKGVQACYQAVLAESKCAKDWFTYVARGDLNCGCK